MDDFPVSCEFISSVFLEAFRFPNCSPKAWNNQSSPKRGPPKKLISGRVCLLVGGWTNPSEKYARQNGCIFPKVRDENKTYLKPTTSWFQGGLSCFCCLPIWEERSHTDSFLNFSQLFRIKCYVHVFCFLKVLEQFINLKFLGVQVDGCVCFFHQQTLLELE